ncbi:MAG: sulfatase [Bryobacteraceae bacterium]|nr:sulfatase [Bryobacteraceae bacterium]
MLNRRSFLASAAAAAVSPAVQAQSTSKPNILFILTDDQRWDMMSCAGHAWIQTPNMDRLAAEGARFVNAFVTTPLCSPSRGSFLTGQYVHKHGILDNSNRNEQSHTLKTWPQILQQHGYETGYFGKWHMGNDDAARPGFDYWFSFKGQGRYNDPEMNRNGERSVVKGYVTKVLTQEAIEFMSRKRPKPFAVCLCHKAIHGPFEPEEQYKTLYSDAKLEAPASLADDLKDKPAMLAARTMEKSNVRTDKIPAQTWLNMARCLATVDDGLGLILEALRQSGQLDNTFIVFTGDNGYFYGEHHMGDKRRAYEEGLRVPLLVRYPKMVKAGSKPAQMALNIDVAPTLLDVAGVAVPKDMHGKSLTPALKSTGAKGRDAFLSEYFEDPGFPSTQKWQSLRTEKWKYIHFPEMQGADELYDLTADPHEMKNVFAKYPKDVARLRARMERILKETA